MNPVLLPWFVEIGFISIRSLSSQHRPPLPSELLASAVIFGALGAIAGSGPQAATPAALTAWGLVIATALSGTTSGRTSPVLGPLNTLGDFLGGGAGQPAAAAQPGAGGVVYASPVP